MNKIAQYSYNWVDNTNTGTQKIVKKPDGLNADSQFSLTNVLEEALTSDKVTQKEQNKLSHNIPCCRRDKSKRDYIQSLMSQSNVERSKIH